MFQKAKFDLYKLFFPWRSSNSSDRSSMTVSKPPKAMPYAPTFQKKRRSEKAEMTTTAKKPKRLTNSGFLDRAFENAWYIPEDLSDSGDSSSPSNHCLVPYALADYDDEMKESRCH